MSRYVVVAQAPPGPKIEATIQFVVSDGKDGTQVLATGSVDLDIQMASLMTAEEYMARYLWPAFLQAATDAQVSIPGFKAPPVGVIRPS